MALLDVKTVPFEVSVSLGWVTRSLARVMGSMIATGVAMALVTRWLPRTRFGRALVLDTAITASAGAAESQARGVASVSAGARGVAETPLRPAGKVRLDGKRWDVVTDGEFLDAGTEVVVASVDGARIVVKRSVPS
jgi:membrane-bound serine protease (ClpP class)